VMGCSLLVVRCNDCKKSFLGGWSEWFCPSCKLKRKNQSNYRYKWIKKYNKDSGMCMEG